MDSSVSHTLHDRGILPPSFPTPLISFLSPSAFPLSSLPSRSSFILPIPLFCLLNFQYHFLQFKVSRIRLFYRGGYTFRCTIRNRFLHLNKTRVPCLSFIKVLLKSKASIKCPIMCPYTQSGRCPCPLTHFLQTLTFSITIFSRLFTGLVCRLNNLLVSSPKSG